MAIRSRRKRSEDERPDRMKDVLDDGVLANLYDRRKTKRTWYNYCVFGGISGLSILAFLLFVNLALGAATMIWSSDIDKVLQNWGQPGSGTEGLSWYPTDFTRDILPIPCHSHNDYWRKVPLFSALRAGCTGTEADVWLFDDDLYVGHNTASLTRNRTFQSLYINPLVQILEKQNPNTDFFNGTNHGVFDTDPGKSLTLLVDVKTSGPETWPWVLKQLEPLRERGWLSFVQNNTLHMRPVTVVGTGNTPFDVLTANTTYRDAFFDAPLETMWEARHGTKHNSPEFDAPAPGELPSTLPEEETTTPETAVPSSSPLTNVGQGLSGTTADSEFNSTNSYYASVSFGKAVGRIWRGRLSGKQMAIIRGQIRGAHRRGLKVRYWDTPGWPLGLRNHVWDVLVREGADVLNVDDLRAASKLAW
ncbi:hypothetical protein BGZ60DRAFT_373500 [Tricladium varicosporioides]|nr:hypothetical protein BGZ60DRAFT_373500 [Hymenoscyphus varicosporioides]